MSHKKKVASFLPVLTSTIGSLFVTVFKFIGFAISGSGVMFSEAVHSLADTCNEALLMIGVKISQKRASSTHCYGYGRQQSFWAVVSTCCIFCVCAGVIISCGIDELRHQNTAGYLTEIKLSGWTFAILLISLVVEVVAFIPALREIREKSHRGCPVWKAVKNGDTATLAVLCEEGVAVLGVIFALIGISLSKLTGNNYWDAIFSIAIGLMLIAVTILSVYFNEQYLVDSAMSSEDKAAIIKIVEKRGVLKIIFLKSFQIGPNDTNVQLGVSIDPAVLASELKFQAKDISEIEDLVGFIVNTISSEIAYVVEEVGKYNPKFNIEIKLC